MSAGAIPSFDDFVKSSPTSETVPSFDDFKQGPPDLPKYSEGVKDSKKEFRSLWDLRNLPSLVDKLPPLSPTDEDVLKNIIIPFSVAPGGPAEMAMGKVAEGVASLAERAPEVIPYLGGLLKGVAKNTPGVLTDFELNKPLKTLGTLGRASVSSHSEGVKAARDYAASQRVGKDMGAPLWKDVPQPSRTAQPDLTPIPGSLPSGRVPGSIEAQNVQPPEVQPRVPAWQSLPDVLAPEPVAPLDITPSGLPSGRVPGGIHNQVEPEPPAVPPGRTASLRGAINKPEWAERWKSLEAPESTTVPPPDYAPGVLPSGRKVGGFQNQVQSPVNTAKVPVSGIQPVSPVEGSSLQLTPDEEKFMSTLRGNREAKDEAVANYLVSQGKTSVDVKEGQPFADMMKQVNSALGTNYRAEINRPDHRTRVATLKSLMDRKIAEQQAQSAGLPNPVQPLE